MIVNMDFMRVSGEIVTETVLWENPNPTTASFASQTVQLLESATNYSYIKILYGYRVDTSQYSIYVPVGDLSIGSSGSMPAMAITDGSAIYGRHFRFGDSNKNSVFFSTCMLRGGSTQNNNLCVPLAIYGIKGNVENSISPKTVYQSTYNTNVSGTSISLTEGKIYMATYNNNETTNTSSVTGGKALFNEIGKGSSWGNVAVYIKTIIFIATASTVSITNSTSRVFDLTVTQLN